MRAGPLKHRVAILRQGLPVDNGVTTKPGEWKRIGTRKADMIRGRGREVVQAEGRDPEYPVTFTLRSDTLTRSITEQDRLQYGARVYHLSSALPNDDNGIECIGIARG